MKLKVAAAVVVGMLGAPACEMLGLGGSGGSGGEACGGAGGSGGAVCNIATQSPCEEKCQADYEDAALECGKIEDAAQRKTCQDNAYATYKECRTSCASISTPACDDKYQACMDNGPSSCRAVSGGKTVCNRCWERCNAGDSPSSACKKCMF
jgi:hypothetical protein